MTKQKILVIGGATIDLIFLGSIFSKRKHEGRLSLAYGGKYVVDSLHQFYGGGGANVAVSLARQGHIPYLWARIAKDGFGGQIYKNLKDNQVRVDFCQQDIETSPVSAILLDSQGKRTIVNYRGEADNLKFSEKIKKAMSQFSWLALFSLPHWPKQKKIEVMAFAKKMGVKVFLSLHGDEYRKGYKYVQDYFAYTDILDLNVYELSSLEAIGASKLDLKNQNYAKKYGIPIVLVTRDKKGSCVYTTNKAYFQPAGEIACVDTTGAGDAFSSGFLGKYAKTGDFQAAFSFADANSAAEINVLGAQAGLLYDK